MQEESLMSGFLGTYSISLDEKGRFNVPAKFRGIIRAVLDRNLFSVQWIHF